VALGVAPKRTEGTEARRARLILRDSPVESERKEREICERIGRSKINVKRLRVMYKALSKEGRILALGRNELRVKAVLVEHLHHNLDDLSDFTLDEPPPQALVSPPVVLVMAANAGPVRDNQNATMMSSNEDFAPYSPVTTYIDRDEPFADDVFESY
jgi:hypothetical protein